jgi:hypothetical protein
MLGSSVEERRVSNMVSELPDSFDRNVFLEFIMAIDGKQHDLPPIVVPV